MNGNVPLLWPRNFQPPPPNFGRVVITLEKTPSSLYRNNKMLIVDGVRSADGSQLSELVWWVQKVRENEGTGYRESYLNRWSFLKSYVHVIVDKPMDLSELLVSVPFELVDIWLRLAFLEELPESLNVVEACDASFAVHDWWFHNGGWPRSPYSKDANQRVMHVSLWTPEVRYLSTKYNLALTMSEEKGIPLSTCWDILADRVVV